MTGTTPGPGSGWPANELEETLQAAVGVPDAGLRLIQVLARSPVWVPLPEGGGPESRELDLPTLEIGGGAHVPVFSSVQEFMTGAGTHLDFAVAPGWEFARGLPPQVGIVVNPGGTIGAPIPPAAVAEMCRTTPGERPAGLPSGARMRLFEPDWQQEPVDFLAAAAGELSTLGYVRTARRGLTSAEGGPPALCIGVETDHVSPAVRSEVQQALGRALAARPVTWPVQLVLMDSAEDPVIDWLRSCITPFHLRREPEPEPAPVPPYDAGAGYGGGTEYGGTDHGDGTEYGGAGYGGGAAYPAEGAYDGHGGNGGHAADGGHGGHGGYEGHGGHDAYGGHGGYAR